MLADGGDRLADLGAVRDQDAVLGAVASDIHGVSGDRSDRAAAGAADALCGAHAHAREYV
jgi:hypothetical protein